MYKYQYCLALLLISGIATGQSNSTLYKCWNSNNKLIWNDFKGQIPQDESSSKKVAVCPNEIVAKGFWEADRPNFQVTVYFLKNLAWTKDTTSLYTLAHEQLHFDIAELYARKLRKKIKELRCKFVVDIEVYRNIIQKYLLEKEELNLKYDKDTAHGNYNYRQVEWEQKIAIELERFKSYASTKENCLLYLESSKGETSN